MTIIHLNTAEYPVDVSELREKLAAISIDVKFINDLGFCPHFICSRDQDDGSIFIDNTNDGYFQRLRKSQHTIIDCTTTDDFIAQTSILKGNKVIGAKPISSNSNALF